MEAAVDSVFDSKDKFTHEFKNNCKKIYMKNTDCGNLEIPEVHPVVTFKGGQKNSK